jgi:hypothetical protein
VIHDNKAFWEHEVKFFKEKPWLQLAGLTPTEAVTKLHQLGWY